MRGAADARPGALTSQPPHRADRFALPGQAACCSTVVATGSPSTRGADRRRATAIALGARSLPFGRTALEPKARLGARPQEMQVWPRHRQPVFNRIVRQLTGFAHHAEAPATNPFRKP